MKRIILSAICIFNIFNVFAQRQKLNFNSDWKVWIGDTSTASEATFKDDSWKKVTLPYAWNEDDAFQKDIADLRTGIAWYRKHFKLPSTAQGQKIFLEFEGVRQAAWIFVNGKEMGLHENGAMAFGLDISDIAKFGNDENIIAVRTDNSWDYREAFTRTKFQWEDRNFNANYGGISKNVFLHITPKVYQTLPLYSHLKTTGTYIYAKDFDIQKNCASIHAHAEVKNETSQIQDVQLKVEMVETNGKPLKTFLGARQKISAGSVVNLKAQAIVKGLHFWSWGYGYLYHVKTSLLINGKETDIVTTTTGFRKTAFKDGMIYLNDRVIMVHGYAQRTSNEWPAIGLSVPAWMSDYSNGMMVESNGNLVRWMHITPWKQDIESCDRVGLMQAMPAGDAEKDVEGTRWTQRTQLMCDAIIYNRNNPSIIFYECGNESISEAHMQEMKSIRDQYDPHGGRAIGSREMLDSKVAEYGGEMLYTNKSAHIPLWAMEYSRDEGSRKYWDDYTPPFHKDGDGPLYKGASAAEYNRNMESHALENVKRWVEFWKERPGTGKRVSAGGVNIVWSETNTHHRGENNYRRSGEVDALRIKKENYYAHKVMWDGWVVPEKNAMHIIGHWNYKDGVQKDIYVISTADEVTLSINGRSMGKGVKSDGFIFTFKNIRWEAGKIAAYGKDAKGKVICADSIKTAGLPYAIRLKEVARPFPLKADGQDLSLVEVEVVDRAGQRCPTALDTIHFTLEGPAEWRGGMAMGPNNYILSKELPVEGGVNRVIIRSTTRAGLITLKAIASGLKPANIEIRSTPYIVDNGLSKQLPSAGLPSSLKRGPTPSTPSYQKTRNNIAFKNAVAGAHSDSAFASYDDNELSDWASDGQLEHAWIEYTLERKATVSQVVLKLNQFRTKSFPIRITLDGTEIYQGYTPTSLGYITLLCKKTTGTTLRIQLLSAAQIGKTIEQKEVNGKSLDDGNARSNTKGKAVLSIIEAECYEDISH